MKRSGFSATGAAWIRCDVIQFYQVQLHRHPEATAYLAQRGVQQPEVVEHMRIGYAPGRCLRSWLMSLGYPLRDLQQAGVVTLEGLDMFAHRIVFPLDASLYGRSIGSAHPHRFLRGGKGGLYGWEKVRNCRQIVGPPVTYCGRATYSTACMTHLENPLPRAIGSVTINQTIGPVAP